MRAYHLRAYPTPRQKRHLSREFGAARWVWNFALERMATARKVGTEHWSINAISRAITKLKRTVERAWLKEVSSTVVTQSLRDLDRAFVNFYEKRASYLRFKKRRAPRQAVRFQLDPRQKGTWRAGSLLVLPKLGPLRVVWSRVPLGRPLMVTVSRDAIHRYFVSFSIDEDIVPYPPATAAVGIDVGLSTAATLSDGRKIAPPHYLRRRLCRMKHSARTLARRKRGSRRRERARRHLAKAHAKVADCRKDWMHKITTSLVRENQVLAVEDLNLTGMIKNHSLALSFADLGLGEFYRQLEYKAAWHGRTFVRVGRFFPSTKRCSACGFVLQELPLYIREWTCPDCGKAHDRDKNAAQNLLQEGLRIIALPPGGREDTRVEDRDPRLNTGCPTKRESHGIESRSSIKTETRIP